MRLSVEIVLTFRKCSDAYTLNEHLTCYARMQVSWKVEIGTWSLLGSGGDACSSANAWGKVINRERGELSQPIEAKGRNSRWDQERRAHEMERSASSILGYFQNTIQCFWSCCTFAMGFIKCASFYPSNKNLFYSS